MKMENRNCPTVVNSFCDNLKHDFFCLISLIPIWARLKMTPPRFSPFCPSHSQSGPLNRCLHQSTSPDHLKFIGIQINFQYISQKQGGRKRGPGPSKFREQKEVRFQKMKVYVNCSWLLRLSQQTWLCPYISVVPEAMHEASQGPLKGAISAQKAHQGSETETRELLGGTTENSISPTRDHWFALKAN